MPLSLRYMIWIVVRTSANSCYLLGCGAFNHGYDSSIVKRVMRNGKLLEKSILPAVMKVHVDNTIATAAKQLQQAAAVQQRQERVRAIRESLNLGAAAS